MGMRDENKNEQKQERPHEHLRAAFLRGEMTAVQCIDQLMALDQSTADRAHATENLRFLSDPEVLAMIKGDPDAAFPLNDLLTLTHFHIGQRKLVAGDDSARDHFLAALDAGEKLHEQDAEYASWCAYVQATIAYCDRDMSTLRACVAQIQEESNRIIVQNMVRGLEQFGTVDYRRDYRRAS